MINENCVAVIQAGGKGTRLRKLTEDKIPKPLLPLNGKPMLEWQIINLKKYGIEKYLIIIGHLGEAIKEYFGNGANFGVHIDYIEEKEPLGSAGALYYVKKYIGSEDFLLIFGDVMFDIDIKRMMAFHNNKSALATLLVHPNSHPYDSDLVVTDETCRIIEIDSKCNRRNYWYHNLVNAGIYIISGTLLNMLSAPIRADLEKDILPTAISQGRVYGYQTTEYVKDAGTENRFNIIEREQKENLWSVKNLSHLQKCIFLDRDGTVNKYNGLVSHPDQLELEKNAAEAIRLINASGYLAIVVTNQPVVARGMCSVNEVRTIHKKLETLLGEQGAYLDDIIFCPHHPDKGYEGENADYKISCDCRKPATGMIRAMSKKYKIDISQSFIIGDSTVDIQTGLNAGLCRVLVHTGQAGSDGKYLCKADMEASNLLMAVKQILNVR